MWNFISAKADDNADKNGKTIFVFYKEDIERRDGEKRL